MLAGPVPGVGLGWGPQPEAVHQPLGVAGMAAGADSIDDMDVLRHGAMADVFDGVRAPSTLGSFLRSFTWGNERQLEAAAFSQLAARTSAVPGTSVPGGGSRRA